MSAHTVTTASSLFSNRRKYNDDYRVSDLKNMFYVAQNWSEHTLDSPVKTYYTSPAFCDLVSKCSEFKT